MTTTHTTTETETETDCHFCGEWFPTADTIDISDIGPDATSYRDDRAACTNCHADYVEHHGPNSTVS